MSTQTQATEPAAETETVEQSLLDAAVAATERRKSIRQAGADYLGVSEDQVFDLLRHKWRPTKGQPEYSEAELIMALAMIPKYDLDPMAKEIYLGRAKDGALMIIIAIDGWIKIVHRTGDYNGHTQELHFDDGGELEWVDTTIYSKTREYPTVYRGFAKEYMRLGGFMKSSIPWHMLRLFSFRHAARFFAPIGGAVVTQEEARWMSTDTTGKSPSADSLPDLTADLNAKHGAATPPPDSPPPEPQSPAAEAPEAEATVEPAGEVDEAHESANLRDVFVARQKRARTTDGIVKIEHEAGDRKTDGGLYPGDYDTVMAACLQRRTELAAAE